jgi:hypothetical protein
MRINSNIVLSQNARDEIMRVARTPTAWTEIHAAIENIIKTVLLLNGPVAEVSFSEEFYANVERDRS